MIPIRRHGFTLEDRRQQVCDEIADHNGPGYDQNFPEGTRDTEDPPVKEDEGGFEKDRGEEVEDLERHESLGEV